MGPLELGEKLKVIITRFILLRSVQLWPRCNVLRQMSLATAVVKLDGFVTPLIAHKIFMRPSVGLYARNHSQTLRVPHVILKDLLSSEL
jgi:hypothetical protein